MKILKVAVVVMSCCVPAFAWAGGITEYTDSASFDASVGATLVEDFGPVARFPITSGILNDQTNEAGIVPGDIVSGVTFSTPVGSGNFFNIDLGASFPGGFLDRFNEREPLTITFDAPQGAFCFETNQFMGPDFDWEIFFTGGGSATGTSAVAATSVMQFFGFQSSETDIESVTIFSPNGTPSFAIDNFCFDGEAGGRVPELPVPTLSTWALLLLVLGMAFVGMRRFNV